MPRKEENLWNRFSFMYDFIIKKDELAYMEIIEQMALILKPEEHVLEIATGTGIVALGLSESIPNIEAVDFSNDMIAIAKKKAVKMGFTSVKFSVQDALDLKYASNSFDTVIISNALHIMPEPEKALKEIKRVLKSEGRLIAPNFVHAESLKAAVLLRLLSFTGFRVYSKWTQQSYHKFLTRNGFEIKESKLIKASFPIAYVVAKQK